MSKKINYKKVRFILSTILFFFLLILGVTVTIAAVHFLLETSFAVLYGQTVTGKATWDFICTVATFIGILISANMIFLLGKRFLFTKPEEWPHKKDEIQ